MLSNHLTKGCDDMHILLQWMKARSSYYVQFGENTSGTLFQIFWALSWILCMPGMDIT